MFPLVPDPTAPPPVSAFPPAPSSPSLDEPPAPARSGTPVPAGPDAALAALRAGNRRFVAGRPAYGHSVRRAVAVSSEPAPFAVVVGCMDSRVPVEAVFDQDFGSLFVVRSAGHVLDRAVQGSVEIAVVGMGVPLVVVLGHRKCAAVRTSVDAWREGQRLNGRVGHVVDEIADAIRETAPDRVAEVEPVTRRHTVRTVAHLNAVLGSNARVVGGYYDVDSGVVEFF
jgi:carbonic anhydrase